MPASSSSDVESIISTAHTQSTTPATSPMHSHSPSDKSQPGDIFNEDALEKEEEQARAENEKADAQRRQDLLKKRKQRKKKAETKAEREVKARELDDLLTKSAAFSDILTKKTQVLGRVGSSLDGKALGEHSLEMAKQPDCMVGGTMRDYQLEGLTWMFEICSQGMSGILADEMGLGKTVQTIALIALLREQENYLGPHLIVAPLSTLSNWLDEFHKWTPTVPVTMYHGLPAERENIFKTKIMKNLQGGRPNNKFPVVCTSYEMVLRDQHLLSRINWEFIIIDEGHRMKNADAKLFQQLRQFTSATRLLITGTPLQNNLKELWSLLHFLLPNIFTDWEAFESWFDFSGLEDEQGTQEFIGDKMKQDLVKKIHLILQPLLLRRIKQDVAAYLPKKREYVLFAPMTKEQTDLYNVFTDKKIDTREYIENKAIDHITSSAASKAKGTKRGKAEPAGKLKGKIGKEFALPLRESPRKNKPNQEEPPAKPVENAFARMMGMRGRNKPSDVGSNQDSASSSPARTPARSVSTSSKRKSPPTSIKSEPKSARTSRQSTPARTASRSRPRRSQVYKEADSDEEKMSDDEFEAKLADELASDEEDAEPKKQLSAEEEELAKTLELATLAPYLDISFGADRRTRYTEKQISRKKLGNPMAQLRLVCNSPHHFYNPWAATNAPIDESIVTASGKMLLLDRLLRKLFPLGHKVLLFSQFSTQLDLLEDYARELRGWKVCRIDGSVSQQDRRDQIQEFNRNPDYRLFLLSTRAGGQGINLASADTVILFDSDFNPQQDLQAQDRCHRIGQTRPVIVYRLGTRSTVEEGLLMSADAKRRLEKLVIKKGGFKTMGQKMDKAEEAIDKELLEKLLLKDGMVYDTTITAGAEILSDEDLEVLCDRSDEAFERAKRGEGDADAFRVVETGADSIQMARKDVAN